MDERSFERRMDSGKNLEERDGGFVKEGGGKFQSEDGFLLLGSLQGR